ncbi:MAG: hypothetical protein K6T26_06975 [Alicyclobacillus sp.]|nr:hypothetical protein [Alicyclobacillus sp.]
MQHAGDQYKVLEFFYSDDPWTRQIVYGSSTSIGHFVRGNRSRGIQAVAENTFADKQGMESFVEKLRGEDPNIRFVHLN